MNEAYITPKLISWARNRAHVSIDDLAKKLKVSSAKIQEWEQGDSRPTLNQAEKIANNLHIPFGYLFLKNPPEEELTIPDLRTGSKGNIREISIDLIDVINETRRRQDAYKEIMINEDIEPLSFIGSLHDINDPATIARNMRSILKIDRSYIKKLKTWSDHLNYLVKYAESVGILVFRSGVVKFNTHRALSTDEFRGFTLCDEIAPVIFINAVDYKSSQIFTFAHELAHLWIGQPGISNVPPDGFAFGITNRNENLCDKVAAEFLVPKDEFVSAWNKFTPIKEEVQRLAKIFKVSSLVILRRSFEMNFISQSQFYENLEILKNEIALHERKPKGEGGDFYKTFNTRNSLKFSSTILEALVDGSMLYREAANLLNIHVSTLHELVNRSVLVG